MSELSMISKYLQTNMPFSALVQSKKKLHTNIFFCIVLYVPLVDVHEQQNNLTDYLSDVLLFKTIHIIITSHLTLHVIVFMPCLIRISFPHQNLSQWRKKMKDFSVFATGQNPTSALSVD